MKTMISKWTQPTVIGYCLMVIVLASCDDFLQREPLSYGSEASYFKTAYDYQLSVNAFYEYLPKNNTLWGGLYTADIKSDNQAGSGYQSIFLADGNYKTVAQGSSSWYFSRLRAINFFLKKADETIAGISDDKAMADHYVGEAYWFRAYEHFRLLSTFGDVPILTQMLSDDQAVLAAASKRYPRNEVARFIIDDLEKAAELMQAKAPVSGRLCKTTAYALIARVALFEATWEKYHAGTCFVPGNNKWPGASSWPEFQFQAGSAEAEVNFFLDKAIEYAAKVADERSLDSDFVGMFTNWETQFGDNDEVILARYYQNGVAAHSCSAFLKNGGGCGVTRAAVNTFLMQNGLPIYAAGSGYHGDQTTYEELQDRDLRLSATVRAAGSFINTTQDPETGRYVNDTIYYYRPQLWVAGNEKSTTGYDLQKWLSDNDTQMKQYYTTTAVPLFRAAECYLIYLEAYYERHGSLGGNCDRYWKALRQRAGVDTDYQKTIDNTDLTQENDLAVYSHEKLIDATLYNIRRERRCELLTEGMRFDDLRRWRTLDMMLNYQPEGMHLWNTPMEKMYDSNQIDATVVSQNNVSEYIRPLQISSTSAAYQGYTFPKQHYLEPIPISEFLLTVSSDGVTPTSAGMSMLYQNPGWPVDADGPADYSYDCD